MAISRRRLLGAGMAATAGALGLAGCRSAAGSGGSTGGAAALGVTWWGNDVRNGLTTQALDAFTAGHPEVTFEPQPGEWGSYWDRLATQVAGGSAPDVIQMDEAYLSEYASRGALLDLADLVDTSGFRSGVAESSVTDGITSGICIGFNAIAFVINPAVFEAAGVDVPDDTTWTWEELLEVAAEVTAASPDGAYGAAGMFTNPKLLQVWLRQQGTELFLADGTPGYSVDLVDEYLQLTQRFSEQGAIPEASMVVEDAGAALDQSLMATGKAGIGLYGSNQLSALTAASGAPLELIRWPSMTGRAADRQAWYKSASLWSVSARSERQEEAAAFIDWWVNDPECAQIVLNERGAPANTACAEAIEDTLDETGVAVAAFLDSVEADLGTAPPLPPPGSSSADSALSRAVSDLLFGNASTSAAAQTFVDDVASSLG